MAVWLIAGTSTGFGHELTKIILENGDIAVATARRPEALAALAAQCPAAADRLLVLKLDVTQEQDVLAAFAAAKAKFGRVDVVANNTGYGTLGEIESVPDADAHAMFETNFWGAARVSREAVRFFREENPAGAGGRLLQFSSVAGFQGFSGMAYYTATKFALEGFSESLASELDPAWNIQVTIIEPGGFVTNALKGESQWASMHPAYDRPELLAAAFKRVLIESPPSGDARKGMEVVYKLASLERQPLHFPHGKDAVAAARVKTSSFLSDTDKYASWSEGLERDA
ncbi:hypothetical protein GSI_10979 [Ganoderma sinense ZZ0214-1]|uniref:Uncharacterized protein n=1 Tax=Ganoderma sinense ZZ0214-1 TaxID=1077348 RepID=A0A2G8S236_9APHY|nr:hypothetical protein GSI_10979 [Ganoderma sinense ZZ0214-1]